MMKFMRWIGLAAFVMAISTASVQAGEGVPPVEDAIVLSIQGLCYFDGGKGTPIEVSKVTTADFLDFCTGNPNAVVVLDLDDGAIKVVDQCGFILCTLASATKTDSCVQGLVVNGSKQTFQQVCVTFLDFLEGAGIGGAKRTVTIQQVEEVGITKASFEADINLILDGTPCSITVRGKKLFVPSECL